MRSDLYAVKGCESFCIFLLFYDNNHERDRRKMDIRIGAGKVTKVDVDVSKFVWATRNRFIWHKLLKITFKLHISRTIYL